MPIARISPSRSRWLTSLSDHPHETHSYACSPGIPMGNNLYLGYRYEPFGLRSGEKARGGINEPAKMRLGVICVRENHRYEEVRQAVAHAKMIKRVNVAR